MPLFPDTEERTHWIGRNSAAMILALAVFPAFAGVVTAAFGWQWALAPCALSLVVAVVTWFVLDAARPAVVPTVRVQLGGVGQALRGRFAVKRVTAHTRVDPRSPHPTAAGRAPRVSARARARRSGPSKAMQRPSNRLRRRPQSAP